MPTYETTPIKVKNEFQKSHPTRNRNPQKKTNPKMLWLNRKTQENKVIKGFVERLCKLKHSINGTQY